MLLLEVQSQPITVYNDRFKVIIDGKNVKVVDNNTKETVEVIAKSFKAPGSPDTLSFNMLPETFDKSYLVELAENNRMGLTTMQIAGSLASWVRKGVLINTKGIYTKANVVAL